MVSNRTNGLFLIIKQSHNYGHLMSFPGVIIIIDYDRLFEMILPNNKNTQCLFDIDYIFY